MNLSHPLILVSLIGKAEVVLVSRGTLDFKGKFPLRDRSNGGIQKGDDGNMILHFSFILVEIKVVFDQNKNEFDKFFSIGVLLRNLPLPLKYFPISKSLEDGEILD